jgi:hypothetical protein
MIQINFLFDRWSSTGQKLILCYSSAALRKVKKVLGVKNLFCKKCLS